MSRPADLPGWPAALSEPMAAAYLSLSVSMFRGEVAAGRIPPPVWLTPGRKAWRRARLDAWLDAKENGPAVSAAITPAEEWDNWCGFSDTAVSLDR